MQSLAGDSVHRRARVAEAEARGGGLSSRPPVSLPLLVIRLSLLSFSEIECQILCVAESREEMPVFPTDMLVLLLLPPQQPQTSQPKGFWRSKRSQRMRIRTAT